jgi:hypothetical protein
MVETLEINFVSVNPKFTNIVTKELYDIQHNDSWNNIKARHSTCKTFVTLLLVQGFSICTLLFG